ncbi:hypothetical protein U1Q18_022951, partial [Sarracenia purpurea var. burkii]
AFGHETEKCQTNKQAEDKEVWVQMGKDKGKAPIQESSPSVIRDQSAAKQFLKVPCSSEAREVAPILGKEVLISDSGMVEENGQSPEDDFILGKDVSCSSEAREGAAIPYSGPVEENVQEQLEYKSASEDDSIEVVDVSG